MEQLYDWLILLMIKIVILISFPYNETIFIKNMLDSPVIKFNNTHMFHIYRYDDCKQIHFKRKGFVGTHSKIYFVIFYILTYDIVIAKGVGYESLCL